MTQRDETPSLSFPGLTPQKSLAAILVGAGESDAEVAEAVGLKSRTTVWRWRTEEEPFQAAVNAVLLEARAEAQRAALARVRRAYRVLDGLMGAASEMVRLKAALAIIDRAADQAIGYSSAARIVRAEVLEAEEAENAVFGQLIAAAWDGVDIADDDPRTEKRAAKIAARLRELGLR